METSRSMTVPKVVFGVPLYNNAAHFEQALESLLTQVFTDFRVVLVDDGSTDGTEALARRYIERDPRVTYYRNQHRLGMTANWRKALELAREQHGAFPYFAWASDHDEWHPLWLQMMVSELDSKPEVVLAYPL